jgi:hypothetical protein
MPWKEIDTCAIIVENGIPVVIVEGKPRTDFHAVKFFYSVCDKRGSSLEFWDIPKKGHYEQGKWIFDEEE